MTDSNPELSKPSSVGPNAWLIDEMFERYRANPKSVSESWQEFFADYGDERPSSVSAPPPMAAAVNPAPTTAPQASNGAAPPATAAAPTASAAPVEAAPAAEPSEPEGKPLRGAAARIVENMEASLEVPTATSFREIPARLLEVNRSVINGYLRRTRSGKVSYTHMLGYAVVRAVADTMPVMNSTFVEGEPPRVIRNEHIGMGLAVDVEKRDGSRTLMVPCIKEADTLDFRGFVDAYEELIRKVRSNKLSPDDFSGVTISLTNPGTIGTVQSVPRLMPGQGLIVGIGTIAFPTAYQAADPATIAELGVSKVITISSTYDHRIIQGAESGMFLKKVHELLLGEDDFYVDIFRSLGVPYEAVKWRRDVNPVHNDQVHLEKQGRVDTLINMYRVRGHLIADLDPLRIKEPHMHPELDPATYGLTIWDLEREYLTVGLTGGLTGDKSLGSPDKMKLGEILGVMRDAYCRSIGIEFMHIQDPVEKRWIQKKVEGVAHDTSEDEQKHILERLNAAEAFEKFLATKYVGQKRFGLEGAESTIPILDAILESAADDGMDRVMMGMAHRGRLNVLINVMGKDYGKLFQEFEGTIEPDSVQGSGDVKYHLGQTGTFTSRDGASIAVDLAANPSHLEAVNPVVIGMARARMDMIEPPGDYPVLPVLIHGDAAFAGQGVVAETLNLSAIKGYRVGGTIHVIINNQLGFTTVPDYARSTEYSTDVAKMVQAPIFHVNGDDPEACVRVARMAFEYRQRFNKEVVIDMICYRRHGHNEGDDPSYTQPLMYRAIEARRSVRKLYTESLIKRGDLDLEQAERALEDFRARLQTALDDTRSEAAESHHKAAQPPTPVGVLPRAETGVDKATLDTVYEALSTTPDGFTVHPKLARQFETRDKMYAGGEVDWALGEAFAYGSLLAEGISVRLAGQDSRRGTFSHRHSTLVDYDNGIEYQPLSALAENQPANLWIYDSLLSEYAALGFDYGYSVFNPEAMVVWEAQFGDFVNGAQIILDQFIVAARDKWKQGSNLIMLLPHGYEGQGPEHSSARIERFLTLAAEDNIEICNATTAAQFFHLLRRQMLRRAARPLVVFTPKSLLRSKYARSNLADLTAGGFYELLDDPRGIDTAEVERVIFCSGKVSYEAMDRRDETGAKAAIVRIEQLYPWPVDAVAAVLEKYGNAREIVWLQEEPENMGAWTFARGRLFDAHEGTHKIRRVSRFESASPATGSSAIHAQEQSELLDRAFGPELFA